jgi:hypothetical protein
MNNNFVIEEKYNFGVGFINLDNTRKLVRHFEFKPSQRLDITLDVYEDGLINCFEKYYVGCGGGGNCYMPCPISGPKLIFTINITNGETINIYYLELIDNIYSPYCCKLEGMPNTRFHTSSHPLINRIMIDFRFCDGEERVPMFKNTFQSLEILKKMYDKIVIF